MHCEARNKIIIVANWFDLHNWWTRCVIGGRRTTTGIQCWFVSSPNPVPRTIRVALQQQQEVCVFLRANSRIETEISRATTKWQPPPPSIRVPPIAPHPLWNGCSCDALWIGVTVARQLLETGVRERMWIPNLFRVEEEEKYFGGEIQVLEKHVIWCGNWKSWFKINLSSRIVWKLSFRKHTQRRSRRRSALQPNSKIKFRSGRNSKCKKKKKKNWKRIQNKGYQGTNGNRKRKTPGKL